MPTIPALDPATTDTAARPLFDAVQKQLGTVPNIFRTLGHSPATLQALLGFNTALAGGKLSARQREQIALACAGANACDYCASAHSALGGMAGLGKEEMARNLSGDASDARTAALLGFVRTVIERRARIDATEVERLRAAGFGDAEIVETVGHIAANLFTNYFNHIAGTEIDFPVVSTAVAKAA
jgi:uncharacterized peroxidase-related enzyme